MFRFIHAADLHLDTPYEGIGRASEEVQKALQDASLEAFDALIELALAREVAFVVISGDIYDGAECGLRAQLRFLAGLRRLSAALIRTFIVHGNHDPLDGWSVIDRDTWPPGVTVFGADGVEAVGVDEGTRRVATVYGMSYPTRDVAENLALRYRRETEPGVHIGVLHANVGSDPDHGSYSPCSLDDLRTIGMDYWALGHIHKREILHPGNPWIVYAGNLQGRSPKASEQGAKGAYVVTVDGTTISPPEFVPLDRTRFVQVSVDIGGIADIPALLARLQEEANEIRTQHGRRGLLVRAVLTGRGQIHADLRRADGLTELRRELREAAGGASPFLWWEDVRAETQPDLDRAAVRVRGDFSADVLRLSDDLGTDPDALSDFLDPRLAPLQKGAIGRTAAPLSTAEAQKRVLEEATNLALGLLVGREAP